MTATFGAFFTSIYIEREYMLLEEELIRECICGNRKAQKELYEKYSPCLFAVCRRFMPTIEDAEDVLVMGFTTVFASLDTFKGDGTLLGWMKKIIINTALNTLRENKKHYEDKEDYENLEQKGNFKTEDVVNSKINIKYIMWLIQQLPTKKRIIFNLCALEGCSCEDVSIKLGVNAGTVRSQLAKARKILQTKIKKF